MGLGWRPETAHLIAKRSEIRFTEVIAEVVASALERRGSLPLALTQLIEAGTPVIPHGVGLSIGDARGVDRARIHSLAEIAKRLEAPLVSEHLSLVRAGGHDSGHLLPLPRTEAMLDVLSRNIEQVMRLLPAPLALENVAAHFDWPENEMSEGEFLRRLHARTGVSLLIDLANLYANQLNLGVDAEAWLDALPIEAIAYVHLAGGRWAHGVYIDTHADPLAEGPLALLASLRSRGYAGGALLERDENFVSADDLENELSAIGRVFESPPGPRSPADSRDDAQAFPVPSEAIEDLQKQQTQLLACLVRDAEAPAGFDEEALRYAARSLANKRAKDAEKRKGTAQAAPRKLGVVAAAVARFRGTRS